MSFTEKPLENKNWMRCCVFTSKTKLKSILHCLEYFYIIWLTLPSRRGGGDTNDDVSSAAARITRDKWTLDGTIATSSLQKGPRGWEKTRIKQFKNIHKIFKFWISKFPKLF